MNQTTHCPECGLRTAIKVVEGELSALYECRCGHSFERDTPPADRPEAFHTQARLLSVHLPAIESRLQC